MATDTSTLVEPGGTGGYWYVDDVDVSGYEPEAQNPYEIIIAGDQLAGALKTFELREQRTDTAIIPEGDRWVEKGLGEWVYRSVVEILPASCCGRNQYYSKLHHD